MVHDLALTEKYVDSMIKSRLLILDGECISNGPVTTVDLPYPVNYGLHAFLDWSLLA